MALLSDMPIAADSRVRASLAALSRRDALTRIAEKRASLRLALDACSPLPRSALLVGLAADGLPVLLDLRRATPVLVAADAGAGKTRLLHTVARSVELSQDPDCVRYAVLTPAPSEWLGFGASPHCEGILSFHHALTTGYMAGLVHWTQSDRLNSDRRRLLLLVDDLRALAGDGDLRDSRSWLLTAGSANGIQPIVTLGTSEPLTPASWLEPFSARVYGRMQASPAQRTLVGDLPAPLQNLHPGSEFALRETQSWLKFWLPEID